MQHLSIFFLFIGSLFIVGCQPADDTTATDIEFPSFINDTHSFARPEEAHTTHLSLNLSVDFDQQILDGYARYNIRNNNAKAIYFDTKELTVKRVTIGEEENETEWEIGYPDQYKGMALKVSITPTTQVVTIYYETTPVGAAAVDWLAPEQTADKKHPFLFTQGQAILTRTWIPCQDSPGIRITYDATIRVPKDLMAVMSASNPQKKNDTGVYTFTMDQPVPPYLLALAVGDLAFAPIGERTGIYAEPSVVEAAAYEFADMEKMLVAAEELYGPYLWERYDVIVLPPSFPFGGMENPRLTFATPTIIAGDRSLTALIAHELAHSWSGNLVTNATWNDFWLNEGFTVYFERRIMEALYGKPYANMLALLGYQDLQGEVEDLGAFSPDTHLHLDLEGRDPDDGMTNIAYEKGAFFLQMLEEMVGRETFDSFLRQYFEKHRFKTIHTEAFLAYLDTTLIQPNNLEVNIDEWVYGPGIPKNIPAVRSQRFEQVDRQIAAFQNGSSPEALETENWSPHEWLHFIRAISTDTPQTRMERLDQTFGFSQSGNTEILAAWFERSIRSGYSGNNIDRIESFLINIGRRKFLTPLYRALKETDQLEKAREIYRKARPNYHSVSRGTMEALLEISDL
jgi:leukotriene-A4 hydrolase